MYRTCLDRTDSTCLMLSRVVRDLHRVQLQPLSALAYVVDSGDVRTLFVYHFHHLCYKEKQ